MCYVDESGTPEKSGTSSHVVLAGLVISIWYWHNADREVQRIKGNYWLDQEELQTN
ncbi:MAG: DUF3800 domain-containing protein [Gammaproteobacteria bacterium]|nr:DUF3800 domain-containing protein [Gammaproteobacteria bacterium]